MRLSLQILWVFSILALEAVGAQVKSNVFNGLGVAFEPAETVQGSGPVYTARGRGYVAVFARERVRIETGNSPLEMTFLDANPRMEVMAEQRESGTSSYFIGRNPAQWRIAVPRYKSIRYKAVYPGIDLVFYGRNGSLEHDWILSPHADPRQIRIALRGGNEIAIHNHSLSASTLEGVLRFGSPIAYQHNGSRRTNVKVHYVALSAHEFGFAVRGYRSELPLVIDPILSYSNFLGGTQVDKVTNIAVDASGNLYAVGWTFSPVFAGFNTNLATSNNQITVAVKLDADGRVVYANFYGSTSGNSNGWGIAVDAAGDAYVCGVAYDSGDFPLVNPLLGTAMGTESWSRAFLLKIDPNGDQAPLYSTFVTTGSDDTANSVAVTAAGQAYVAGLTRVASLVNVDASPYDAFVVSLNPAGSAFNYPQAVIHGDQYDAALGIAVDDVGNAYVTGFTYSGSLKLGNATSVNPKYSAACASNCYDGFVAKVTNSGAGSYITFIGGSNQDTAIGIAVDSSANVYVAGTTASNDFVCDMTHATAKTLSAGATGRSYAVLAKLNNNGNLVFASCIGGNAKEDGLRVALDGVGNIWIGGRTSSSDFPTANATYAVNMGGYDAFVLKLDPDGKTLLFSTYFGGVDEDEDRGIATLGTDVFIGGWTTSGTLPHTAGGPQFAYAGGTDGFVAKLANADIALSIGSTQITSNVVGAQQTGGGFGTSSSGGNTLTLTFAVTNRSAVDGADNVTVPTTFPSWLPITQCTYMGNSCMPSDPATNNSIAIPTGVGLSAAKSFNVTVQAAILPGAPVGHQEIKLHARSDTNDPNEANNSAMLDFDVPAHSSVPVTFNTTPSGLSVSVDGAPSLATPFITNWDPSQQHTFTTSAIQGSGSTRYVFSYWSNGVTNITTPTESGVSVSTPQTFTAAFDTQYLLTVNTAPVAAGTFMTSPRSPSGYFSSGTQVAITAMPEPGYEFLEYKFLGTSTSTNPDVVTITGPLTLTADFSGAATGLGFFTLAPCRAVDTRMGQNKTGNFGPPGLISGDERTFPLGSSVCPFPSTAQAFSLNLTVAPQGPLQYLSAWPAGQPYPFVSTLNSTDGSILANAALVPSGGGSVSVLPGGNTDFIVDANGYFAQPNGSELLFYPVTPCRVVDTRTGQPFSGAFGPPSLVAGNNRDFSIRSSACNIPASATAFSLNLTAVPQGPLSFLSAWPSGQPFPNVSTLNAGDGTTIANAAIVPAGDKGAITIMPSGNTDFIMDINGYFAPPTGGGLHFYVVTPCRVADTRSSQGFAGNFGPPSLAAGVARDFPILASNCGIPSTAKAYSLNMTVVPPGPMQYLSVWPAGQPYPNVSTLNSPKGTTLANAAIVPSGTNGAITVLAGNPTDLIIDINGYFAP